MLSDDDKNTSADTLILDPCEKAVDSCEATPVMTDDVTEPPPDVVSTAADVTEPPADAVSIQTDVAPVATDNVVNVPAGDATSPSTDNTEAVKPVAAAIGEAQDDAHDIEPPHLLREIANNMEGLSQADSAYVSARGGMYITSCT